MTEQRAEWGGLLPPGKAIELLEKCAAEGRELLNSTTLTEFDSVEWAELAAHLIRRTHGPNSSEQSTFQSRGSLGVSPHLVPAVFHTRGRQALARQVQFMEILIQRLRFDQEHPGAPPPASVPGVPPPAPAAPPSNKVFVVHGHDHGAKEAVARCIERLDLEAVILHEQPNGGKTVIEKLEQHADVGFAVVLLTPDDLGAAKQDKKKMRARARQNVIMELGFFIEKLGRSKVFPLCVEGVEQPSDILGVVYELFTMEGGAWRSKLTQELRAAGLPVKADA